MNIGDINNFFGDIDLFLMDLILKNKVPEKGYVLDAGCGSGRNGIYFLQNEYIYTGIDNDPSALMLLRPLLKNLGLEGTFLTKDLRDIDLPPEYFDFIICSRVLHFANSMTDFKMIWGKLLKTLKSGGLIYVAMDSVIGNKLAKDLGGGHYEFPDSKCRFGLTDELLGLIMTNMTEEEPIKTLVHGNEQAQSFLFLRKNQNYTQP